MAPPVARGLLSILVSVPISTYYLSPSDFGVFAVVVMISALYHAVSVFGTAVLHGHYFRLDGDQRKVMLFNTLLFQTVLNLFICLLFRYFGHWVLPLVVESYQPVYLFYFDLSLLGLLLSNTNIISMEVLVLENRSFLYGVLETAIFVVGLATNIICFAVFGLKALALFIGPVAMGLLSCLCCALIMAPKIRCRLDWRWIKEATRRELPQLPDKILGTGAHSIERYFIQRWYSLSLLGLYNHSLSYRAILVMVNDAFRKVLSPGALKAINENQSLESVGRIGRVWIALLGVGGVFMSSFSLELLDLLTHGKFVAAAPLASMWFVYVLGLAWGWFLWRVSHRHPDDQAIDPDRHRRLHLRHGGHRFSGLLAGSGGGHFGRRNPAFGLIAYPVCICPQNGRSGFIEQMRFGGFSGLFGFVRGCLYSACAPLGPDLGLCPAGRLYMHTLQTVVHAHHNHQRAAASGTIY